MAEKQVLFRLEGKLLSKLDKKLTAEGYKTRNKWFREAVSGYLTGRPAKAPKARKTRR
ncbi:MAG: hypothetical protein ACYDDF_13650 [Thermoplasmatota archaeon]